MRFTICITAAADGWQASVGTVTAGNDVPMLRHWRRGVLGYPHPDSAEQSHWPKDAVALCAEDGDAAVAAVHERILVGDPQKGDVAAFGGYLLATMLGPWWPAIEAKVRQGPIDLDIELDPGDWQLQRIPWEMMMTAAGPPLAALPDPRRRVAITRVVAALDLPPASAIELPLRVLFVVGRQMDEALRPGAEYLALLRQFDMTPGMAGTALHTRLLVQANRETLQEAIDDFRPAVVHIVAHGRPADHGAEILLTRMEGGKPLADPVTAEVLQTLLRGRSGQAPRVQAVLLNACHTGEPDSGYLPFAAALVAGGVPVVIGMSGEVADGACRVFTRAFYRGLIEAEDLATGCAQGRRAAVLHYGGTYLSSVEWGRPTLFRASGVTPRFETNAQAAARYDAARQFRQSTEVLCGRMGALGAFEAFCRRVEKGFAAGLAYEVDLTEAALKPGTGRPVKLGKRFLLSHLVAQAALEGFVPCRLPSTAMNDVPANFLLLALQLAGAMNTTREKFGVDKRVASEASSLAFMLLDRAPPAPAPAWRFEAELEAARRQLCELPPNRQEWASRATVEQVILADLRQLMTDVGAPAGASAMIFIDDLHRYEGVEGALLKAIGTHGLGDRNLPAPVVFTCNTRMGCGPRILEQLQGRGAQISRETLAPFDQPVESTLAYRQYMLSLLYAPNNTAEARTMLPKLMDHYDKVLIRGVPSYLVELASRLRELQLMGLLVPADDEKIMGAST